MRRGRGYPYNIGRRLNHVPQKDMEFIGSMVKAPVALGILLGLDDSTQKTKVQKNASNKEFTNCMIGILVVIFILFVLAAIGNAMTPALF